MRDITETHGLNVDLLRQQDILHMAGIEWFNWIAMHIKFADHDDMERLPAGIMCRYPVVVPKWDRENLRNDWFLAEYIEHFYVSPKASAYVNASNPDRSLDALFLSDHIKRSLTGINTPYKISPPVSFMGKITKRNAELYALMDRFNGTFPDAPENYAYEITDDQAIKSLLQTPFVTMPHRHFCEIITQTSLRHVHESFGIASTARDYTDCGGYNFAMVFSRGISCITAEKIIQVSLNSDGAIEHWKEHQNHIQREHRINPSTVLKNMLMSGVQQLHKEEWLGDTPEENSPENILRRLRFQSSGEKEIYQEMFNLGCTRQRLGRDDLLCTNIETTRVAEELVPEMKNFVPKSLSSLFNKELRKRTLANPRPLPL